MSLILGQRIVLEPIDWSRPGDLLEAHELVGPADWAGDEFPRVEARLRALNAPTWMIVTVPDPVVIGVLGSHHALDSEVEIGLSIVEEYRNRGIGTEAIGLLCDWLFVVGKVKTVRARTAPDHLAAAKVLLKNGFEPDGRDADWYCWVRR